MPVADGSLVHPPANAGEFLGGRRPKAATINVAQVPVPDRRIATLVTNGDRHFHGAVGAGQVVEVVREVPQDGTPLRGAR